MRIDATAVIVALLRCGGLAVACISGVLLAYSCTKTQDPAAREQCASAMWNRVGNELAALAAKQKTVTRVILIRQEVTADANLGPGQDIMEAEFKNRIARQIKPAPEICVVSLPAVPPPAPKDYMNYQPFRSLKPDVITEALDRNKAASLIVSLLGEPTNKPPEGKSWPPIICFSRNGADKLAGLIRAGVVAGAIAPRHTNPSDSEKDWFELRYTVVTPESVNTWCPPRS